MTSFTEVIEVDGSSVPGAARRLTMEQQEFVEWWNNNNDPDMSGWNLLGETLAANGDWVSSGEWRFRRRIS